MTDRVVVFFDWQNIYRRGRAAFGSESDPHVVGQVEPLQLAQRLVRKKPGRELQQVRVYRGIPTNVKDPKGYAANRRHTATWMQRGGSKMHVYLRPLQYLPGMDPREKGIDVQLAIDFVVMAVKREYDVGILFSTDTDMEPAIEGVCSITDVAQIPAVAEVAAWSGPNTAPRRLGASSNVWCHWLDQVDYQAVQDPADYGSK